MALHAGQRLARARGQSAQRNALIDLHVVADIGGLADNDAGGVVDEEVLADLRAGVDVDAGAAVGVLGHDARDERHVLHVQLVRDAVHEDGEEARIAEDDLFLALGGRVAVEGRLHVGQQDALDFRQAAEERGADLIDARVQLFRCQAAAEQQRLAQLAAQRILDADERFADEVLGVDARGRFVAEVTREHDAAQVLHDVHDGKLVREMLVRVGEEDLLALAVVFRDACNDVVQLILVQHDASLSRL